jgi:hypothetical protein
MNEPRGKTLIITGASLGGGRGGADHLHQIFRGYKDRGELASPEESARRLVDLLSHNPERLHGKIVR